MLFITSALRIKKRAFLRLVVGTLYTFGPFRDLNASAECEIL